MLNKHTLKVSGILMFVVLVTAIAILQVREYQRPEKTMDSLRTSVESQVVQLQGVQGDGELGLIQADDDELSTQIRNRIRLQLRGLPEAHRPIEREIDSLSNVVSEYFMFQREAALEDLLKRYEDRGIDPRPELVQADRERANKAWLKAAAWARTEEVRVDSIEMLTVFLRGRLVGQLRSSGGPINSRRMSTGQFLLEDSAGFTVYEMRIKSTVQVRLGGSELDATVSVLFINDGPRGEWNAISSALLDLPTGTRILPPYP
jgi:hypothetical protein